MDPLLTLLIAMPLAFLAGSIPFSLLLGLARGVDIRTVGSGNVGATNLGRALGTRWFLAGFSLDALKGLVPVALSGWLAGVWADPSPQPALAWAWLGVVAASVLGHMFSPWVGFKGGKGVATSFGAMLGGFPILTLPVLVAFILWGAVLVSTRLMGVASCVGALALPLAAWGINAALGHDHARATPIYLMTSLLALLVVYKHRGNLLRTLKGTEPRFGRRIPSNPNPGSDPEAPATKAPSSANSAPSDR